MLRLPALLGRLRQFMSNLDVVVARAERRYATQASIELLELYRSERREHPQLDGRSLYEAVIARRLGDASNRAGEILRRAEESFTDWPVERELRFRHVVHYQIFDEYTHLGSERPGTRTNLGLVVARIIPEKA
jgi:hypothetical protein